MCVYGRGGGGGAVFDLLERMLKFNAKERISVMDAITHPTFDEVRNVDMEVCMHTHTTYYTHTHTTHTLHTSTHTSTHTFIHTFICNQSRVKRTQFRFVKFDGGIGESHGDICGCM
jgi:hypothetical protein